MRPETLQDPIRLGFDQKTRRVLVTPEDQDRFCMSVDEAIAACRAHVKHSEFDKQFRSLLNRLGEWVDEHGDRVKQGVVTLREGAILFLAVQRAAQYDGDLEDELTALDVAAARDPSLDHIRLTVRALPACRNRALLAFINPIGSFDTIRK